MAFRRISVALALVACILARDTATAYGQPQNETNTEPRERVLAQEPKTPEELLDAVLLMLKLGRVDLGKEYLSQFLEQNPADDVLLRLRDKHGTATFSQIAKVQGLQPEGPDLLQRLIDAVAKQANDPAYFNGLLRGLKGSPRERDIALSEMRHLGSAAVPPLLDTLQSGEALLPEEEVIYIMTLLGRPVIKPLIGALRSPVTEVRVAAAEVLGHVASQDEMHWLWKPAFAEGEELSLRVAAREGLARILYDNPMRTGRLSSYGLGQRLVEKAMDHLRGDYEWPEIADDNTTVSVWLWDAASNGLVERPTSPRFASLYLAEQLARDAAALNPSRDGPTDVLLTALLQRDAEAAGWDNPIPNGPGTALDLAVQVGPEVCARILELSLDHQIAGGALGSLRALALNGSEKLLAQRQFVVVMDRALNAPSARIQFAAATAILQWEPTQKFVGSRRVVEILARALMTEPQPQSVVVDPNVTRASQVAGFLGEIGYRSRVAETGVEGFRLATKRGDIELAVVHLNSTRWELSQTLANLRADHRTTAMPVAIYGPPSHRTQVEALLQQFQPVVYVEEANDAIEVNRQLKPLLATVSPPALTPQQRSQQALDAAYWLRRIAQAQRPDIYDLSIAEEALLAAVGDEAVALDAIVALGGIGRPSVQKRMADLITSPAAAVEAKRLAAYELAAHVQRHGLLLARTDLDQVMTAWESSTDESLRVGLSSLVGSLKPQPAGVRRQIVDFPESAAPLATD